jgi:hypothetical protein
MSSVSHIHKGDIGVVLKANVNSALHDLEYAKLIIKRPGLSDLEVVADLVDPNVGIISYKSQEGDFDEEGKYQIQAKIHFKSGAVLYGAVHSFFVTEY